MKFQIDPIFEKYWPPLPDEKFIILEKSILDEGLRENLIVWKEKNILLDGHQRLRICKKRGIPFEDRITYLSFPDEVHAKHWVHITQAARRGDAPQFLSICHVLEFEPIYIEEAKGRMSAGGKKHGKGVANGDTLEKGRMTVFMERDSATSEHSIQRVLYIRKHDPARFKELKELAEQGKDYEKNDGPGRGKGSKEISIHLEHSKVKATVDAQEAGVKLDKEALEKFPSSNTVRDFADSVRKFKPPINVQKTAAEAIVKNQQTADKNWIEDQIIHRLPKKEPREKEKNNFVRLKEKMALIEAQLCRAVKEIEELHDLREETGDDLYFQALAESPGLRAAFARFIIAAKSFQGGGKIEKKKAAN